MIKHYPVQQLGKANHGWLKSSHHFSFAQYYDPKRMGFGTLRVVNDDWVEAGAGFSEHPHKNMEIISFVRSGGITHKDSHGNKGTTTAGEVQVMSAGTGITHSEYNMSDEALTFYQIWIKPDKQNVKPRWESKIFPQQASDNDLSLLVSGYDQDKDQALFINQKARIYGGRLNKGALINFEITHQVYVLASSGRFEIENDQQNITMQEGDGAEVSQQKLVTIKVLSDAEIIIIDAP